MDSNSEKRGSLRGVAALGGAALLACFVAAAADSPKSPGATSPKASCAAAPLGEVRIPAGRFRMGSDRHYPEEQPVRQVAVGEFWIDRTEVTNAQFADFVAATGYVTIAEKPVDPARYPGAPADMLKPGAMVFAKPAAVTDLSNISQWWKYVPGAYWRAPEGPGSSIAGRENHPVVHVTYADAMAYARWRGRDLPTEAEWEYAARGGLNAAEFTWGNEARPGGRAMANHWQGRFPVSNQLADGFAGTAPVGCFPANGYGLFDMAGNVWEIVSDDWSAPSSTDPGAKVAKGGSFLCADNFCGRYRPASRQQASLDAGTSHIGFRTVRRPPGK